MSILYLLMASLFIKTLLDQGEAYRKGDEDAIRTTFGV
jgi:hypothetical protein